MAKRLVVRISKEFRFEAAHALWNYDGPCRNIHGHSYVVRVTVTGSPTTDPGSAKLGMLIDFSDLKHIVHKQIIEPFDHALMINASTPHADMVNKEGLFGKTVLLPYQPTCENMVADFAGKIDRELPPHVHLHSLRLYETPTSYAEWVSEDNPH